MKERVRETIRQAILEAVEEVAGEHGIENTSTAAIAERAGVAVGTLYNYFADRDELLAAWLRMRRGEIIPRLVEAARSSSTLPFEQRLRTYLHDVMSVLDGQRRFIRILASLDHEGFKKRDRQQGVMVVLLEGFRDILRPVSPNHCEQLAHMLVGAARAIVRLRGETDQSMAADAELIADVFVRGIARA